RKYSVRELLEGVRDEPALRRTQAGKVLDDHDMDDPPGLPPPMVRLSHSAYHGKIDFGILTIREDENRAVLDRFDKVAMEEQRRRYRIGRLVLPNGGTYALAVLRCLEQGNTDALAAARDLLEDLAPQFVLVVGIAGGVPSTEFSLGDVVVSSSIADFSV